MDDIFLLNLADDMDAILAHIGKKHVPTSKFLREQMFYLHKGSTIGIKVHNPRYC